MEQSALKSEYLIKHDSEGGKNPKLDWSILKYINRICLQKGINLKSIGLCNVDLDLNIYELDKKNEKGLYLFKCVDISSYYNKNLNIFGGLCNSMKDFKIKIEVPDLNDDFTQNAHIFSYKPSMIVKKVSEKSNLGIFSYKAVFEIYQYIHQGETNISEKLNGVITLLKNEDNGCTIYLGRTEDSMKFKITGKFSAGKQCMFNFCRFNCLKPEKIKFEIFTNNVNIVPVGFIYKYCRATFDDLESDKIIVYLPEESDPDEKMWFIAVANIINLILFDKE